ncbi:MAG TPA: hypothetical protein IAC62_06350 [Candidatus Pelethocola excrementipullorum]|nr:hypothetical protein [Candidatus Pelethocola excrementipullorum]
MYWRGNTYISSPVLLELGQSLTPVLEVFGVWGEEHKNSWKFMKLVKKTQEVIVNNIKNIENKQKKLV